MSKLTIIDLSDDRAAEAFSRAHRDPRLATVKKDATVPAVGDTVVLNDCGIEQVFGRAVGLSHMKTMRMKVTKVADESCTFPEATFPLEVDNPDINQFLIDHKCFDIVKRAADKLSDPCPDCGTELVSGGGGGVRCPKSGCGYWFCY